MQRPKLKRRRRNGRLVPIKCSASARNAKPKVKFLTHGGYRSLLRDPLDKRSRVAKAYAAQAQEYRQHLAGNVSVVQEKLIDRMTRFGLIADWAWGELIKSGYLTRRDKINPALEPLFKACREERAIQILLGIERKRKPVPDLKQYIEGKAQEVQES